MSTPGQRLNNKIGNQLMPSVFEQNIQATVSANIVEDDSKEIDRITKYTLFWKFYDGLHYNQANDSFISLNYIRAFIDKINQFLLGDEGFSFKVQSYYSDIVDDKIDEAVSQLIMSVWRKNRHKQLIQEILQMGGICGDAWVGVFYNATTKKIEIKLLDSRRTLPKFKDGDTNKLESIRIVRVLDKNDAGFKIEVTEYTDKDVIVWKQKHARTKNVSSKDKFDISKTEHSLGVCPVIHFKNKPNGSNYYSVSDAEDIMKLNKVYNELHQEVKAIIDYHVAPTTVVTGATLKNMTRGIGKVWSGLPPEANVFNLGLDVDMSATMDFLDRIKTAMHELADIPEGVLGKIQAISGTSAAALKMTYQPLYQKAHLKSITYGEGIKEVNDIIMRYYSAMDGTAMLNEMEQGLLDAIPEGFADIYECAAEFSYGFPIDRLAILQELQMEFQLSIVSIDEAMKRLGKNNIIELKEAIKNDAQFKAELEAIAMQVQVEAGQLLNPPPTQEGGNTEEEDLEDVEE